MKRKSLLAMLLAIVMTLSLCVPVAVATTGTDPSADTTPAEVVMFPDLYEVNTDGSDHWAKDYCLEMYEAGVFTGYTDGTFRPNDQLTTTLALVLCARMMNVDSDTAAKVLTDRTPQLIEIFGAGHSFSSWAFRDFALCLEGGIVSFDELNYLNTIGALDVSEANQITSITKQDLAMYMVRAMQLEPLAESQKSVTFTFSDENLISPARRAHVYLMNMYAIVQGTDQGTFEPFSFVNRAVMATMISRAMVQMENRGIDIEFSEYTTYSFYTGVISKTETNTKGELVVTLASELSGDSRQVTFDASNVNIVTNNMEGAASDIKVGEFARVSFTSNSEVDTIRLFGSLTAMTGAVESISTTSITIRANDVEYTYPITRFTQVKAGDTSGDRSLLAGGTGYASAVCRLDSHGNLAQLQLTGGTRAEWGIISGVGVSNNVQYIRVNGADGMTAQYPITSDTIVTINALSASLSSSYLGAYVSLQINNDDGTKLTGVAVDTTVNYVQGVLTRISSYTNRQVTISNAVNGNTEQYTVTSSALITHEGETLDTFNLLTKDSFITLQIVGGEAVEVISTAGYTEVVGTLTGLEYGDPITMTVQRADGVVFTYSIPRSSVPTVTRSGASVTIDKLVRGDQVEVSLESQEVRSIVASPREADVTGTIEQITSTAQGQTYILKQDNGESVTYTASVNTPVTKDGEAVSIYSLKYGDRIALVLSSDQIQAIELKAEVSSTPSVSGTITYIGDLVNNKCTLIVKDSTTGIEVSVQVSKSISIISTTGESVTLSKLALGDSVMVYYQINSGVQEATLIIK